jgi:eukaryotic-like serine/threonine-protein kinase
MSTLVRCINGHEVQGEDPDAAVPCPVCGAVERSLLTPPTLPDSRPALSLTGSGDGRPRGLTGYTILEEIGRGGMGVVYKARQEATGEIVALKVIRKERLGGGDLVGRFRREALAAARVQHPGVVRLNEVGLDGDPLFLAMEYVPGLTLQQLVEQQGPLSLGMACDFVRQTAQGLQHAHEQGLVHRDIKPANLMVVAPNGMPLPPRPVIKVLDLGVARLTPLSSQDLALTTLTRDGSVIGTPDYIAPEQLEDARTVDGRADLYALGCTFYFLLTGQVPFPGGSLIQKLDRQRYQIPVAVNQIRPEIPSAVAAIVRRLMAKHPDDRYASPGELAGVLETVLRTGNLPDWHQPMALVPTATLTGHGVFTAVVFLDDKTLVSGGADRTIRVWDLASGKEKARLGDGKHGVGCLALSPTTGQLFAGQGVTVRAYDANGREALRLSGHNDAVRCMALTADGKRLLTGSVDRTVRLWDLARGCEIQRFALHRAEVTGVALSPDGRIALSCSRDGTLRMWETSNGKEVRAFGTPRGPVMALTLTPDGQGVYSGHFDTTARLWEVATGRELRRFGGHKQMVGALAAVGANRILSASHDQTIRLWDAGSGAELAAGQGHTGAVAALALSPSGAVAASAGFDQAIRLWALPG